MHGAKVHVSIRIRRAFLMSWLISHLHVLEHLQLGKDWGRGIRTNESSSCIPQNQDEHKGWIPFLQKTGSAATEGGCDRREAKPAASSDESVVARIMG